MNATVTLIQFISINSRPQSSVQITTIPLGALFHLLEKSKIFCLIPSKHSFEVLHVHVTVHRDNLRINNQQDASSIQNFILSRNSTCFGHLLCPSSGFMSCTRGNWYVSCRLCGRYLGELEQPDSPRQRPHNLHETYELPRVQLITPDDGHSRSPKRDKIKFWIRDASCWLFIRSLMISTPHPILFG